MKKISTLLMSIILGIGMIGCSSTNKNEEISNVNGSSITVGNYEKVLELEKQSIEAYYGNTVWDQEVEEGVLYKDKFKELVLDQMVYTELIYQEAEKENVCIGIEGVHRTPSIVLHRHQNECKFIISIRNLVFRTGDASPTVFTT